MSFKLRPVSLRASSQTGAAIRFSQTILTDSHVAALLVMTIFPSLNDIGLMSQPFPASLTVLFL